MTSLLARSSRAYLRRAVECSTRAAISLRCLSVESSGRNSDVVLPDNQLSPSVVQTMLNAALLSSDNETIAMLMDQASHLGADGQIIIEKALTSFVSRKNFSDAALTVAKCGNEIVLPAAICNDIAVGCVNNLQWDDAFALCQYMIQHNIEFSNRVVLFTVSGLMTQPDGLFKLMELIALILDHRRSDLVSVLDFSNINMLAGSLGNSKVFKRYQVETNLKRAMDSWISASNEGFHSFALAKLLAAVASASRMDNAAASFISQALAISLKQDRSGLDDGDVLSLIRAFSKGDGIVLQWHLDKQGRNIKKEMSPIAFTLLNALLEHCGSSAVGSDGVLKCMDYYMSYWQLAYRLRGANRLLPEGSRVMDIQELHKAEEGIHGVFMQLVEFQNDASKLDMTMECTSGSQRRLVRLLCDRLGLRSKHQFRNQPTDWPVFISKQSSHTRSQGCSLEEVLHSDALLPTSKIQFDGTPLLWDRVREHLLSLDESVLYVTALKLANGTKTSCPSISWLLLISEVFIDRNIPLPSGFLSAALRTCNIRKDIYGVIELLQLAHKEKARSTLKEVQKSRERLFNSRLVSSDQKNEYSLAVDRLGMSDWNLASDIVYSSRNDVVSYRAFQESFMEVVALRKKYGVDLDTYSSTVLLKFLTQSMSNPPLLKLLLNKVQRQSSDADTKAIVKLTHIECLAISRLLLHTTKSSQLQFSSPLFMSEHYLSVNPSKAAIMAEQFEVDWLAGEKLKEFRGCWSRQHQAASRAHLFNMVKTVVEETFSLGISMDDVKFAEQIGSLVDMVVYSSYLIASNDKQFNRSFDTLHLTLEMLGDTNQSSN